VANLEALLRATEGVRAAEESLARARQQLRAEVVRAVTVEKASFSAVARVVGVSRQRIAQITRDET
jgi:predicted XRE-type DNA-binding protein